MISIYKENEDGFEKIVIQYKFDDIEGFLKFYDFEWNRSIIINKLIRNHFTQDQV